MVGTGWATSHPDCMDRLRKDYSHFVGGWFLARKAAWALSGSMRTADKLFFMLVNGWAWLIKVTSVCFGWKWPGYGFSRSLDRNGDQVRVR